MKKTLLVAALAAVAMSLVSCFTGMIAEPEAFTIKYTGAQYGAPTIKVPSNWKSVTIEFDGVKDDDLEKLQIALTSDKEAGPASWDPSVMTYVSRYVPLKDSKGKITIDFDKALDLVDSNTNKTAKAEGATKYTDLALQLTVKLVEDGEDPEDKNAKLKALTVKVKSAIATKNDGYQEAFVLNGDGWASTVTRD